MSLIALIHNIYSPACHPKWPHVTHHLVSFCRRMQRWPQYRRRLLGTALMPWSCSVRTSSEFCSSPICCTSQLLSETVLKSGMWDKADHFTEENSFVCVCVCMCVCALFDWLVTWCLTSSQLCSLSLISGWSVLPRERSGDKHWIWLIMFSGCYLVLTQLFFTTLQRRLWTDFHIKNLNLICEFCLCDIYIHLSVNHDFVQLKFGSIHFLFRTRNRSAVTCSGSCNIWKHVKPVFVQKIAVHHWLFLFFCFYRDKQTAKKNKKEMRRKKKKETKGI